MRCCLQWAPLNPARSELALLGIHVEHVLSRSVWHVWLLQALIAGKGEQAGQWCSAGSPSCNSRAAACDLHLYGEQAQSQKYKPLVAEGNSKWCAFAIGTG